MSDKNADTVLEAVARNVSAVLSLPSAGMLRNHKSRFLCEMDGGILMEAPAGDGPLIGELLKTRTPCAVSFRSGIHKVAFVAPLKREERSWKLNAGTVVDALLLDFPKQIQVTQKRSDYRVEIPKHCDMTVRLWRLGRNDDFNEAPPKDSEIAGQIFDLSIGGIGVKLIGTDGQLPKVCAEDRLRIELRMDGTSITVEGNMRAPRVLPEGQAIITGIKFKTMEDNFEGRKLRASLLRIVGELQRQELRMTKLGLKKTA